VCVCVCVCVCPCVKYLELLSVSVLGVSFIFPWYPKPFMYRNMESERLCEQLRFGFLDLPMVSVHLIVDCTFFPFSRNQFDNVVSRLSFSLWCVVVG
jgi:hypothetical protein